MNVFVTGATGFIGQHLVRRLVKEGHRVRCLVRKTSSTGNLAGLNVVQIVGDINDAAAVRQGMAGCDWVFHLANLYSMWEPSSEVFWRVNVDGTRFLMECALEARVKRVVYVSTVAVYGKPERAPFDENTPPGPVLFSEYARSKAAAERDAWQMYRKRGLPLVVLYPGIVLGAGDDKASGQYMMDILRRRVPTTIFHQSASTYVYVKDLVEALICAAETPTAVGQKYLIGKSVLTGKEFAQKIHEESGVALPPFHFPDFMVVAAAHLLTAISIITHRPPPWGLSVDAARTLKQGFHFESKKAERELGIEYTPIREAVYEAVLSYSTLIGRQKREKGGPGGDWG